MFLVYLVIAALQMFFDDDDDDDDLTRSLTEPLDRRWVVAASKHHAH